MLVLLAALSLAGCSGDSSPVEPTSSPSPSSTAPGTNATTSTTLDGGNGTGNQTARESWSQENRTGTVSGTDLVITDPPSTQETFTVANGTLALQLNLSVQGDAMRMSIRDPGCSTDDCAQEVLTQSGEATHSVQAPLEGTWTLVLEVPGPGPVASDYTLAIAQLRPST